MQDGNGSPTSGLKGFQRKTVNYVFERLFGRNPTARFLIADEVGLGKTLVAKGLIGRTLDHLKDEVDRIDIIYVCSNAVIAKQNVARLVPPGINTNFSISTRLTYLPKQVSKLRANRINFISFTPTTAFDHHRSRGGHADERLILYRMLEDLNFAGSGLFRWRQRRQQAERLQNLLQATSGKESWRRQIAAARDLELDPDLTNAFRQAVLHDPELCQELADGCHRFRRWRPNKSISPEDTEFRYQLIAKLRSLLASECLSALAPQMVILDEFQRFKDLLDGENEAADLAKALFTQPGVRVLLLSATPYKMFTLDHEREAEDHYPDFLRTLSFLYNDDAKVTRVEELILEHRRAMQDFVNGARPNLESKRELESTLLEVMCRTERVAKYDGHKAMLIEKDTRVYPTTGDLAEAAAVDAVAQILDAPDQIEYWKSTPNILNYMRNYELRRRLDPELEKLNGSLRGAVAVASAHSLTFDRVDAYSRLDGGNARLRALLDATVQRGMWELMWMPASMPYAEPAGVYRGKEKLTKALVFSAWNAVPNAIASIVSYEAERRMLASSGQEIRRTQLYERNRPLLRFAASHVDGRLTGMPVLAWLLPSPTLATTIDPLRLALANGGVPLTPDSMHRKAVDTCRELAARLPASEPGVREDERWYWAAPILLESDPRLVDWCASRSGWHDAVREKEMGESFNAHIEQLVSVTRSELKLGPKPHDLVEVLADLALGGPGVCSLRALGRLSPDLDLYDREVLKGAAVMAEGFRTLFNMPENIAMLKGGDDSYWRRTLQYAIDGNLQSVLDEYVHVLRESLGLHSHEPRSQAQEASQAVADALSLRATQVRVDELRESGAGYEFRPFNSRNRFALRFANLEGSGSDPGVHAEMVRDAFNSPFRPFVLASTSVGQEGLDFHTWCHAVWHWNLPSNPVDLEQREGRVNRYKGHAVRKNLAEYYGLSSLGKVDGWSDPWAVLFALAEREHDEDQQGLVPYWVFGHGSNHVERHVPLVPFSREVSKLKRLKKGLALYRMVFGQPRQEDLLAILQQNEEMEGADVREWLVSLEPPHAISEPTGR